MKLKKIKLNELVNAELNGHEMLRILGGGDTPCDCLNLGDFPDTGSNQIATYGYHGAMPGGSPTNANYCVYNPTDGYSCSTVQWSACNGNGNPANSGQCNGQIVC